MPSGKFILGSQKENDPNAEGDEMPSYSIHLDDYYISKTPITNAQYAVFVQNGPYPPPQHWGIAVCPSNLEQHPVVFVSWYDACNFCKWANVRLPSEQEWEKAARGTNGHLWPWGNEPPNDQRCNFINHVGKTTSVDKYATLGASPFGLLDTAGNAWEWVENVYCAYGDTVSTDDPENQRVMRGGSFYSKADALRCANRSANDPQTMDDHIGFRVVRLQSEPTSSSTQITPTASQPGNPIATPRTGNLLVQQLYRILIGPRISLDDLEDVCFRMDIDWDNLKGEAKRSKARSLIEYCTRTDRLPDLLEKLRETRVDLVP